VAFYQIGIKTGLNPVKKIAFEVPRGVFYKPRPGVNRSLIPSSAWQTAHKYFGRNVEDQSIPNWHMSCLTKLEATRDSPWFEIGDFDSPIGDIKGVWEASRFDWVIAFAQRSATGNDVSLTTLNEWLNDWTNENPPYNGVNWKCGQEASIRVMHLACAAMILEQVRCTSDALLHLVEAHLQRISPTILYAVAQDNNHGTSEAAALFVGGDWLSRNGNERGIKWREQGRKWLENRAKRLIMRDGSFSQYSTNYHRVMLDAYSIAEVWRRRNKLDCFSEELNTRLQAAISWIYDLTDDDNGDVPNFGANDGARLLPLCDTDYRDFRPSIQLAASLFHEKSAWQNSGSYDLPLGWLGIDKPSSKMTKRSSVHLSDGGYFILRNTKKSGFVFFSYPKFQFRPSQNDALHVDFWVNNENVLRDGGTYSYNAGQKYIDYYGGVKSHNTVEIDNSEPMPRLSRFLLGEWLKPINVVDKSETGFAEAGYKDYLGRTHQRQVCIAGRSLIIKDEIKGVKNQAVLRWRLKPGEWVLTATGATDGEHSIEVTTSVTITRLEIVEGRESRYYHSETVLPVLEIEVSEDCTLTTEYIYN
jgi:hypothetical protein